MKNSIDIHVEFSFKGEDYSLKSTLNLDKYLEQPNSPTSLHEVLAKDHGVDTYSYLYEVMLESGIEFSNAQGLCVSYFKAGSFDLEAYRIGWQEYNVIEQLQPVARQLLKIDNLDQHPNLKNALLQAYHLGRRS